MNSGQFLDAIKKAYGLETDYQLMKFMGWDRQTRITNYRKRGEFDTDTAAQVAEKLHLDPLHVIACMEELRAKDKERRAYWRDIAERTRKKVAKVAAAVAVTAFMAAGQINGLSSTSSVAGGDALNTLYIM